MEYTAEAIYGASNRWKWLLGYRFLYHKRNIARYLLLWISNVFSPNEDRLNDEYIPNMDECTDVIVMAICDRWGEKVFETKQLKGWNGTFKGKPAQKGVYLYYAEFNTPWGIRKLKGTLTLIR